MAHTFVVNCILMCHIIIIDECMFGPLRGKMAACEKIDRKGENHFLLFSFSPPPHLFPSSPLPASPQHFHAYDANDVYYINPCSNISYNLFKIALKKRPFQTLYFQNFPGGGTSPKPPRKCLGPTGLASGLDLVPPL